MTTSPSIQWKARPIVTRSNVPHVSSTSSARALPPPDAGGQLREHLRLGVDGDDLGHVRRERDRELAGARAEIEQAARAVEARRRCEPLDQLRRIARAVARIPLGGAGEEAHRRRAARASSVKRWIASRESPTVEIAERGAEARPAVSR